MAIVLKNEGNIISCADIVPVSPSAEQTFPSVTAFSRWVRVEQDQERNNQAEQLFRNSFVVLPRYDFRQKVASVLQMDVARITILPASPVTAADGRCQKVSYVVSGKTEGYLQSRTVIEIHETDIEVHVKIHRWKWNYCKYWICTVKAEKQVGGASEGKVNRWFHLNI